MVRSNKEYGQANTSVSISKIENKKLNDAKKYISGGDFKQAVLILEQIVGTNPLLLEPLYLLGICLVEEGRYVEAVTYLKGAIKEGLDTAECYSTLAIAYKLAGSLVSAISNFQKSLEIDETNFTALKGLGDIFHEKTDYLSAIDYYHKAVIVKPSMAEAQMMLALALSNTGEYKNAVKHADKAIKLSPKDVNVYGFCGRVHLVGGNVSKAERNFKKAIDLDSSNGTYYSDYISIKKIKDKNDPIIRKMEKVLKLGMSSNSRRSLHFALGQAYSDSEQWDKAFDNFSKGNLLKPTSYNKKDKAKYTKKIIKSFPHSVFQQFKGVGNESVSPVFIVGMPRSGSTLIDQVLSSHSHVESVGESKAFTEVDLLLKENIGVGYPEYVNRLTNENISVSSNRYLDLTRKVENNNSLIVDKMLFNYLYLGLIVILFPNAKIIHSKRNPLDSSLSSFSIDFVSSGAENEWSSSLDNIGYCYSLYNDLMEHWASVLPVPILNVCYEDMVEDFESNARKIIQFCDLEWEDSCLEFYKAKRSVQTASVLQVRQPIYKSSVSRWPPYAKYLAPLVEQLGDLVKEDYEQLRELGCDFNVKKQGLLSRFF